MCALHPDPGELADVVDDLGADVGPTARPIHLARFNVGPAARCVIAMSGAGSGTSARPVLTAATWGLHLGGHAVINLRLETAGRGPGLQRCVVPTDGFYAWTGAADQHLRGALSLLRGSCTRICSL